MESLEAEAGDFERLKFFLANKYTRTEGEGEES